MTQQKQRALRDGRVFAAHGMLAVVGLLLIGCATTAQPTTQPTDEIYDHQEKLLKDPMNYSLDMEKPDITGGGIGDYDPKAMDKDLKNVLDP